MARTGSGSGARNQHRSGPFNNNAQASKVTRGSSVKALAGSQKSSSSSSSSSSSDSWFSRALVGDSKSMVRWDLVVILMAVWTAVSAPLRLAFRLQALVGARTITADYFADLVLLWDLHVQSRIITAKNGVLEFDVARLRHHYFRSAGFWVDLLCTVPVDCLFYLYTGSSVDLVAIFRLLRVLRLRRIAQVSEKLEKDIQVSFTAVRFSSMGFWIIFIIHVVACLWYIVGDLSRVKGDPDSWILRNGLGAAPWTVLYLRSLYFSAATLATVGYGDLVPKTSSETAYAIVVLILSQVLSAYVIGNVSSVITGLDAVRTEFRSKMMSLGAYMEWKRVPQGLRFRIRSYFEYIWASTRGTNENEIFSDLPSSLQSEVAAFLHLDIVRKVPLFQTCTQSFLRVLVTKLRAEVALAGDIIMHAGDLGSQMYIIARGTVAISPPGSTVEVARLGAGNVFGEIALLARTTRTATIRAVEICELYALSAEALEELFVEFPGHRELVRAQADTRAARRELEDLVKAKAKAKAAVAVAVEPAPAAALPPSSGRVSARPAAPAAAAATAADLDIIKKGKSTPTLSKGGRGAAAAAAAATATTAAAPPESPTEVEMKRIRSTPALTPTVRADATLLPGSVPEPEEPKAKVSPPPSAAAAAAATTTTAPATPVPAAAAVVVVQDTGMDRVSNELVRSKRPHKKPDALTLAMSQVLGAPASPATQDGAAHGSLGNSMSLSSMVEAVYLASGGTKSMGFKERQEILGKLVRRDDMDADLTDSQVLGGMLGESHPALRTLPPGPASSSSAVAARYEVTGSGAPGLHKETSSASVRSAKKDTGMSRSGSMTSLNMSMSQSQGKPGGGGGGKQRLRETVEDRLNALQTTAPEKPGVLYPSSKFIQVWDVVVILATIYNAFSVPLQIGIGVDHTALMIVDYITDFVFLSDIAIRFYRSLFVDGLVIDDLKEIKRRYLRGKFVTDMLCSLPFDLLVLFFSSQPKYHYYLRLTRFYFLTKVKDKIDQWEKILQSVNTVFLRIGQLGFWVILLAHVTGCAWYLLAANEPAKDVTWADVDGLNATSTTSLRRWLRSLYWAATTLTTVGYGDIVAMTSVETVFVIVVLIGGQSVYALIIGSMSSLVANADILSNDFKKNLEMVTAFSRWRRLPPALHSKIVKYYDFLYATNKGIREEEVLEVLSSSTRDDIALFLHQRLVSDIPLFSECTDPNFARRIVSNLSFKVAAPGDLLVRRGAVGKELFILVQGTVNVSTNGQLITSLTGPTFFGEVALLSSERRKADVTAETYCELYTLSQASFDAVLVDFPQYHPLILKASRDREEAAAARENDEEVKLNMRIGRSFRREPGGNPGMNGDHAE